MKQRRQWLFLALGVAITVGVFLGWLQPAVVRGLLDASIGAWCS